MTWRQWKHWTFALALAAGAFGCGDDDAPADGGLPDASVDAHGGNTDAGALLPDTPGAHYWVDHIQQTLADWCGDCHVGERFAFASLERRGPFFTAEETARNYERFLDQISLDDPEQSRLLMKAMGGLTPEGLPHAGGAPLTLDDDGYDLLVEWINLEKQDRCPECGTTATSAWVAYVEQPRTFWAIESDPIREDHGLRTRARILLQAVDAGTMAPAGEPLDFLGDSFCGADGRCDFGNLAVSHDGTRLAFECRLSLEMPASPLEARWNVCVAEIGTDGRAVNPRFLMPESRRHRGDVDSRSDPFGLYGPTGEPLEGPYDLHFQVRRHSDRTPAFSADDREVILASQGRDPRSGSDDYQTYHGFEALDHIVAVDVESGALRTIYRNEGGVADFPFLLRNGNVVFHTWNLERMDRHLYTQSTADGMMELPVLLGRLQGPNMWGKAVQLNSGVVLGTTGRRRSSIENYVLFTGDHTLGLGLGVSAALAPLRIHDTAVFEQVLDFPGGYCDGRANPEGPSCVIDRFSADPSWAPDGRALIAHNPERTYVMQGEDMFQNYAPAGMSGDEAVLAMDAFVPHRMGISLVDRNGVVTPLLEPRDGYALRYPVWVGRRWAPRVQPVRTDETQDWAELHIADVPVWMSFRDLDGTDKHLIQRELDRIVALRVLVKEAAGNACLNDARPYRFAVNAGAHDHPTHLGINNSSGYARLAVPMASGGDAFGDVPLAPDRSVRVRVPAGELMLIQGVDADGHVVRQHERVFALPPGQRVDTGVQRSAYPSQCASCHGSIDEAAPFVPLTEIGTQTLFVLRFDTDAAERDAVDLTAPAVEHRRATYLHGIRPLLDRACVSCHSGAAPAGELSLAAEYSATGNYPAGRWATSPGLADAAYLGFVPTGSRVRSYDWSPTYAWVFREDGVEYRTSDEWRGLIESQAPLADLAPWDPGYQNLFANDGTRWVYLGGYFTPNFGRSDRLGGVSKDAWLIEILTGRDLDLARTFTGPDHTGFLTESEIREIMAVIDVGFPYMARCDDQMVPSGPNAGQPWGTPSGP